MSKSKSKLLHKSVAAGFAVVAGMLICAAPLQARITKIVVDETVSPAFCKGTSCASFGDAGQYEQIAGRAFGELDPADPLNKLIQDIELGKDPDGKVRYVATFVLTKPVDMAKASGLLWHDVPNRGRPVTLATMERGFGDVGLASAWQGDNAGMSAALGTTVRATMSAGGNHWLQVPVAKNPDGSPVTGSVFGRIINRSGLGAQPLIVQTNPLPYLPASLDTSKATLVSRDHESTDGVITGEKPIAGADWQFCGGGTFEAPLPLTQLPVHICLKGGFNPAKLYQVVYTAKDPHILGIGFAAWRDVASFFKYAAKDDFGTANPLPHTETINALRVHFRNWVMHNTPPPDSRYPTLRERQLVEPAKAAMGFPTIPGLRATAPEAGFINALLDYDWGPGFDPNDGSGVPSNAPPPIKQVLKMLVPRVNTDGNEIGGVPVVLLDAPLGTYLGWNITAGGARPFHQDQICSYAGGMIPFARTRTERMASGDPRLSLEERYTDHAGYVATVRKAAANIVAQGFLLQQDADALIAAADASNVLK